MEPQALTSCRSLPPVCVAGRGRAEGPGSGKNRQESRLV